MRLFSITNWRMLAGLIVSTALGLSSTSALAQGEPENGPPTNRPRVHALINARIITSPGEVRETGTIIIRNGVIDKVSDGVDVPPDARVWDLSGHTIHAGFIDASVPVDSPDSLPASTALHWNDKVRAQFNALEAAGLAQNEIDELRKLGFTTAQLVPDSGVFRGTAVTVALTDADGPEWVYNRYGPTIVTFESGGWGSGYPSVLIGVNALIRQTLLDAQWFAVCWDMYRANPFGLEPPTPNDALAALRDVVDGRGRTFWVETSDEFDLFRAKRLAREFDLHVMVRGSGTEYRRLGEVLEANVPIVLPIRFPDRPDIASAEDADQLTLRTMLEWEQAPTNPRRLLRGGATIALTTDLLDKRSDFIKFLRRAMDEGLTEDEALAALTTTPARLLGQHLSMGRIERGMAANLVVIDGQKELFGKDRKVRAVWVNGDVHLIEREPKAGADGRWDVSLEEHADVSIRISDQKKKIKVSVTVGEEKADANGIDLRVERLSFVAPGRLFGRTGWDQWTGVITGSTMVGEVRDANGQRYAFTAELVEAGSESSEDEAAEEAGEADTDEADDQNDGAEEEDTEETDDEGDDEDDAEKDDDAVELAPESYPIPLGAYGRLEASSRPEIVVIRNATVWTSADQGIIENADVIVRNGKFAEVGSGLSIPSDATIIEGKGKHITPGLVDAHSHTGIERGSINEGSQAISAEVRISDAIMPDDVDWYRQLAGGLTTANQLHGSANPIGGQNSVVRLRWGSGRNGFVFDSATPGIKFALGENVKRPNSRANPPRYPRTRMGVESLIRSAFLAARDYADAWERYEEGEDSDQRRYPPRRDLELDALAEILRGERLIHCHSYRQDEILMLMELAEDLGFTVGTFQHVLEGFKVADEIAAHGAAASTFSDWWAYKIEVYDAIPHNGAIMQEQDVLVSFNSDSDELARRMNTEAAKAVRYGGVDPAEALKFVTINPAIQLGVDDRVGSIEVGKDADFVVWSGNPLSTLSRCEQTWIEGEQYFSLEEDARMRQWAQTERQRLIQKILRDAHKDPDKAKDKKDDGPMNERARKPQQYDHLECMDCAVGGER